MVGILTEENFIKTLLARHGSPMRRLLLPPALLRWMNTLKPAKTFIRSAKGLLMPKQHFYFTNIKRLHYV